MPLDRLIAASPEEVGIDAEAMAALFLNQAEARTALGGGGGGGA